MDNEDDDGGGDDADDQGSLRSYYLEQGHCHLT